MFDQPFVSVIIPTYNRAHIIHRAITSVLQQTYQNLEIIIVDDASKDETEAVISSFQDERIRYIRHPENYGGADARNTGISAASGEYITFLDSDDVWLPNKVELQLQCLINHPQAEKVVSYTQVNKDHGNIIYVYPERGKRENEPLADYLFLNQGLIQTGTLMLCRSFAQKIGFKPGLRKHQDLDFGLRLEQAGAIFLFLEKPLTTWYIGKEYRDRLTLNSDYKVSLDWVNSYRSLISNKAYQAFVSREVVPKLIDIHNQKFYAEKLLLEAVLAQAISIKDWARLTGRMIFSPQLRQRLKRFTGSKTNHD